MPYYIPYQTLPDPAIPIYGAVETFSADNTTSLSATVPTCALGDRLVLALAKATAATFTGLGDWTEVVGETSPAALYVFEKAAVAADVAGDPYTVGWTGNDDVQGLMVNVDQCGAATFKASSTLDIPKSIKIMLHCNGSDGSSIFTNSAVSGQAISAGGNAQIDTAQSIFGGTSALFDGSSDWLTAADHADFELGTNDCVFFDGWARIHATTYNDTIAGKWLSTGNQRSWRLMLLSYGGNPALLLVLSDDGINDTFIMFRNFTLSLDSWFHIRVFRSSGYIYMYIDGTLLGPAQSNSTDIFNGTGALRIGGGLTGLGNSLNGWLDEILMSNGDSFPVVNFIPPTEPYGTVTSPAVTTGSANNFVAHFFAALGSTTGDTGYPADTTGISVATSPNSLVTLGAAYEAAASPGTVSARAFSIDSALPWVAASVAFRAGDENPVTIIPSVLIDSYASANVNAQYDMYGGGGVEEAGQLITLAAPTDITSVKFALKKTGSPTGNVTITLKATTGTIGSTATPTGAALATATFDAATLTTSFADIEIPVAYSASSGGLALLVSYAGGNSSNYVSIGRDSTSPTHAGNAATTATAGSGYTSQSTDVDLAFELWGIV